MRRRSANQYAAALIEAYAQATVKEHPIVLRSFLMLLRRDRAMKLLPMIMRHIQRLEDKAAGVTRVHVSTARELAPADLHAALKKHFGKTEVEMVTDPSLIAGITLRVGDMLVDASTAGKLKRLHTQLVHSS